MRIDILKRAKINIIFGTINKIAIILCPFVQRIFIQKYFGSDYIGLNSLFSSIFSVLNLSELGLNSAILSFIYKPMADDDVSQVNSILNFYKKAYKAIGIVILILGLVSSIFIPRLARDSQCIDYNLYYIYFIMLFNCVIGYFLYAYVTCIFIANQRDDVKSNISTFTIVLLNISQIGIIIYTKNYYLFVLLVPIFTIITNILSKYYVNKLFPQYFPSGKIGHDKLVAINKLVAGSAISKISSASRHSLDSIFAAVFLGLTLTGFYNNYYMVLAGLSSFLSILATSFTGGIGNHIAYKTKEENLLEWKKIDFMYFAVSGCVTCILLCTYQPMMTLWLGKDSLLDYKMVILFCIYFYVLKFGDNRYVYLGATGLWWENKYRAFAEAVANFFLNYLLIKLFGIYGIILASIVSIILFNHLGGAYILFKYYFGISYLLKYHMQIIVYSLHTVLCCCISYYLCHAFIQPSNLYVIIIKNTLLCCTIYVLFNVLFFYHKEEFRYLISKLHNIIKQHSI